MAQTLRSHINVQTEMERYGHVAGIVAASVVILGIVYFVCLYLLSN